MKFIAQKDQMDCGPACLAMIASWHGKIISVSFLREKTYITREGVSLLGISEAARTIGFEPFSTKLTIEKLVENKNIFPCIIHWNQNHFVVLRKISKGVFFGKKYFHIADPGHGFIKLNEEKFKQSWISNNDKGVVLFLHPTDKIHSFTPPKETQVSLKYLFGYLKPHKIRLIGMFLLLLFGSGVTLVLPFLTQALIDKGINAKDLNIIWLILLAQLSLFLGSMVIDIFRNWIMLYVGTKLSIRIISDFFKKLLQLPIKFFDTKMMGDFNQRIQDNERIEGFLTSQSLLTFFSVITFLVFFGVLWYYDVKILIVYLTLTVISICWSLYWLRKRKILDYFQFQQRSENQESVYQIINGVTEMKLNQFEDFKRKEWENIQLKLFKINIRILKLDQLQVSGFGFLNQLKNILVTFLAATYVVQDRMTLGALLSVSYIIGQMNSPVNQLLNFFRSFQDAKLSIDRLNEVQVHPEEEQPELFPLRTPLENHRKNGTERGIHLRNISFRYEGPKSPKILDDINFIIPEGKITAIVGTSGSGKTTLMKLLLKFYEPTEGCIYYNKDDLETISPKSLRKNCGVVMQDGFIFSDTIERNIATCEEIIDKKN